MSFLIYIHDLFQSSTSFTLLRRGQEEEKETKEKIEERQEGKETKKGD